MGDALHERNKPRAYWLLERQSDDSGRREPLMRRNQNHNVRQDRPTSSTALSATEAIEQPVREHPVVHEVMRLFDARIVAIEWTGTREGAECPTVEQQVLFFSSQV